MANAVASLTIEDHSLPSSDGESALFVRHYRRGSPRTHFLIVHGALEHSGRHQELIDFWLKTYPDVAVTVYDHLGHGRSGGTRCYTASFKYYVDDLHRIGEFVNSKNHESTKTFICAHSMGGLIVLTRILDSGVGWAFPLQGMIFSAPCIRPKTFLEAPSEALLVRLDILAPKLHIPTIYSGPHLTHDPDRANDFDTDPLIPKFLTVRMAKEIFAASAKVRGLSYYMRTPSLFLIPGEDLIVDQESALLFAQGIDKRTAQIVQYPEHYHELWNESDRQEIFLLMKKWVEKQLKERP